MEGGDRPYHTVGGELPHQEHQISVSLDQDVVGGAQFQVEDNFDTLPFSAGADHARRTDSDPPEYLAAIADRRVRSVETGVDDNGLEVEGLEQAGYDGTERSAQRSAVNGSVESASVPSSLVQNDKSSGLFSLRAAVEGIMDAFSFSVEE